MKNKPKFEIVLTVEGMRWALRQIRIQQQGIKT